MAILPRNLLKSFFERGDKPNESQFGSLIDSMLHSTEDQAKLGLRVYDAARTYIAGEAVIYNGSLYQALATTTGTFNPVAWQKIFSLGSVTYRGVWDASTNSPALTSSQGTKGDYYVVSVSGSTTLDGNSTWMAGDEVIFNGTAWERVISADEDDQTAAEVSYSNATSGLTASSVQAAIDEVDVRIDSLTTGNITEDPASNLYYTDARVASSPAVTTLDANVTSLSSTVAAMPWETYTAGGDTARLDSSSYVAIIPNTDNGADLGIAATRWRDLYIAGNINFSSTLEAMNGANSVASFHAEGMKVGFDGGTGVPHLSVDPAGTAGKLYTINNNDQQASVIGNYLQGTTDGLSIMVTGGSYPGTEMLAPSSSVIISDNQPLNIGTSGLHTLSLWTEKKERLTIDEIGTIKHLGETAFSRRTYYTGGEFIIDINWPLSNVFVTSITEDVDIKFHEAVNFQEIKVVIRQTVDGTFTITWPSEIKWESGIPVTASPGFDETHVYTFIKVGDQIFGSVVQHYS